MKRSRNASLNGIDMGEFDEAERIEREKRERNFELHQQRKSEIPYDKNDLLNDIRKQREIEREKREKSFTGMESSKRKELIKIANQIYVGLKTSNWTKINGNQLKNEIKEITDDDIEENEICYVIGIMKGNGHLRHIEQLNIKLDAEGQVYEVQETPVFVRKSKRPFAFDEIDDVRKMKMQSIAPKTEKELFKHTKKTYNGEELKNIILTLNEKETNIILWGIEVEYIIKTLLDKGCMKQTEQKNVPLHSVEQTYELKTIDGKEQGD